MNENLEGQPFIKSVGAKLVPLKMCGCKIGPSENSVAPTLHPVVLLLFPTNDI